MTQTVWSPLLTGALAAQALDAVEDIAREAPDAPGWTPSDTTYPPGERAWRASLAGGWAGQALFHAYRRFHDPVRSATDLALDLLDQAADQAAEVPMRTSLFHGFSGIAWVAEHLRGRLFEEGPESNDEVDEGLLAKLSSPPWKGEYDLLSGLVGLGVYALERLPLPAAVQILERVVERLAERAAPLAGDSAGDSERIGWLSSSASLPAAGQATFRHGLYNLGVAHGAAGVIALLGAVCAAGVAEDAARPLLTRAVQGLLSLALPPERGFRFPTWHVPGEDPDPEPSRLAWCYGDLGIAAALWVAGQGGGEASWRQEAVEIARLAAGRPEPASQVRDAGLCHGAAGVGHLFNRLYQATGEERLGAAARFWFGRALDQRQPGLGVGGFRTLVTDRDGARVWGDDAGFLLGASGVGLALLAAISPVEPEWDRAMLLSLAPYSYRSASMGSSREALAAG